MRSAPFPKGMILKPLEPISTVSASTVKQRGDEVINISVYVPETLTREEKEQMKAAQESDSFKPSESIKKKIFNKFRSYFD